MHASVRARARLCVCQNESECMRERERQTDRKTDRERDRQREMERDGEIERGNAV